MRAFESYEQEYKKNLKFTYPEEMKTIIDYIEKSGKCNLDYKNLEKAWYVFSEIYDATFLTPDDQFLHDFGEWLTDYDVEEIRRMNYYGYMEDTPYEPWKEDFEYKD